MEKNEIIEGNRLIDIFMTGREPINKGTQLAHWRGSPRHRNVYDVVDVDKLKYHTSWDWLMPVVDKIETLDDMPLFIHHGNYAEFSFMVNHNWPHDREKIVCNDVFKTQSRIGAVYDCVVKFIQWHNQQLTTK